MRPVANNFRVKLGVVNILATSIPTVIQTIIATKTPLSTVNVALQQSHDGRFRTLRQAAGQHGIAISGLGCSF
jgi:hypothetical protein